MRPQALCLLMLTLVSLSLSGCGFHLRGNLPLPSNFQSLSVQLPPDAQSFKNKFKERLRSFRIHPHFHQKADCYLLVIDELKFNRQIANISSSTTPRQFQLSYTVSYHVIDPQGESLIPHGFAIANRLVSMNSERLLGSNYEQDFFRDEMEDELVVKILSALSASMVSKNHES